MNQATLVGRVGQDPELKYFESGSVKARFSLAVDRGFGQNKTTDWFNIEAWGKQAEFVGEWVKKGTMLAVFGTLENNTWTDAQGQSRETFLIRASSLQFVGSKKDNASGSAGGGGYHNEPAMAF
ncbi:MAG: single-stranded DNA-binding protein [Vampirovibrionales bacterium]